MKKKFLVISAAAVSAVAMGLTACVGTPNETVPVEISAPVVSTDTGGNALNMSVRNGTNTATAIFTAAYGDNGITLTAEVTDDDVYTGVYYSYGYDDNVEYLINLNPQYVQWDASNTYHFLITADGDTYLQKANSPNGFGESYAVDLKCVNGGNFSHKAERTSTGYKTEVFLGYDLLGTDKNSAYGKLCVCPAMRNTHDYADSIWAAYSEYGCDWGNASSFIKVGAYGYIPA